MGMIVRDEVVYSDLIAIADDRGKRITYKELAEDALKMSHDLEERSMVLFLCDHSAETAAVLYKFLYLNLVPLLLPDDINRELLENLIMTYRPRYIFCGREHEMRESYPDRFTLESHALLQTTFPKCRIHPDVAVLMSTSGTTGSPKLVKLSYGNLYSSAEHVCALMGMKSGQKGISPLSMSYVYGFTFCLWHWHCGATLLVTQEPIFGRKFQDFYTKERTNHFAGTPYTYQMLQKIDFWEPKKLEYLKWAASGGGQILSEDHAELVKIMKDKFWIMYGQTECTGTVLCMNFDENNIKLGSVGRALNNTEVQIDENTNEIILKSENVCMGYAYDIGGLADGDVNQGVLRTGDVGYMDEDGCIYLRGRLTRYVKLLGKRVSLDDIESYLDAKFPEAEFACIGMDDSLSIFYAGSGKKLGEEIYDMLNRDMKIPYQLMACTFCEKIPRNSAGKIRYGELENE